MYIIFCLGISDIKSRQYVISSYRMKFLYKPLIYIYIYYIYIYMCCVCVCVCVCVFQTPPRKQGINTRAIKSHKCPFIYPQSERKEQDSWIPILHKGKNAMRKAKRVSPDLNSGHHIHFLMIALCPLYIYIIYIYIYIYLRMFVCVRERERERETERVWG